MYVPISECAKVIYAFHYKQRRYCTSTRMMRIIFSYLFFIFLKIGRTCLEYPNKNENILSPPSLQKVKKISLFEHYAIRCTHICKYEADLFRYVAQDKNK